jgi:DNA-binding transcriptional ArsR family regulator
MINSLLSKTKRRLLALLLLNPDRQFYLIEIARLTGISQGTLHREIKSLVADGILLSEKRGNQTFYSANRTNPIYEELRGILFKTYAVGEVLAGALKPYQSKLAAAFVYGSVAKGSDTGHSDIDLFCIGDMTFGDLTVAVSKPERTLGRPINIYCMTPGEFAVKIKEKNHFVSSVLKSEKTFV